MATVATSPETPTLSIPSTRKRINSLTGLALASDADEIGRKAILDRANLTDPDARRSAWQCVSVDRREALGIAQSLTDQMGINPTKLSDLLAHGEELRLIATAQICAAECKLDVTWLVQGNLGVNGLATVRTAVKLAHKLGDDISSWKESFTAANLVGSIIFDLQQRIEAPSPIPVTPILVTPTPVVEVKVVKAKAKRPPKGVRKAIAAAKSRSDWSEVIRLGGQVPASARTMPAPIQVNPVTPIGPVVIEPIAVTPVYAKVTGHVGNPGDRIIVDDRVLYICNGKSCFCKVDEANAFVSTQDRRVKRAYGVELGRHLMPEDLDCESGHPIFCSSCAPRVLRSDSQPFTDLIAKAQAETTNLVKHGRTVLQAALRITRNVPSYGDLFENLGRWAPGIQVVAKRYFASPKVRARRNVVLHPELALKWAMEEGKPRGKRSDKKGGNTPKVTCDRKVGDGTLRSKNGQTVFVME